MKQLPAPPENLHELYPLVKVPRICFDIKGQSIGNGVYAQRIIFLDLESFVVGELSLYRLLFSISPIKLYQLF